MVKKKLLTLAAVIGILACGACFFGPLPERQPPPPPIHNGLDGVHSIRVEVANASPSHHLDSAALARKIVETINEQSWKLKINAQVGKEAGGEEAVLEVTVLSESVEGVTHSGSGLVKFLIGDSAALRKRDGALIWSETNVTSSVERKMVEENPEDAWKKPELVDGVFKAVSIRLVNRMANAR
jgi:hypothetical protein